LATAHACIALIQQLAGEYGLRNKREIWRIQLTLSKVCYFFLSLRRHNGGIIGQRADRIDPSCCA
jgi:hypothetical protein